MSIYNKSESVNKFCGIKKSVLIVNGSTTVKITLNGRTKENLSVLVLLDNTMTSCVVLGRYVLKAFQMFLVERDTENEAEAVQAIMNIDVSDYSIENIDKLRINEEISIEVEMDFKKLYKEQYVDSPRPETPEIFHIDMEADSVKYTAFVTLLGHFEYFINAIWTPSRTCEISTIRL